MHSLPSDGYKQCLHLDPVCFTKKYIVFLQICGASVIYAVKEIVKQKHIYVEQLLDISYTEPVRDHALFN